MKTDPRTWKHADARRRIHIWPGTPAYWAFGPTGSRFRAENDGAAFAEAMERNGREPAVVIYEGRGA